MKSNKLHVFFLFIAAFFWGTTFVAQNIGAGYVSAFTYLAGRSWIAIVVLTPVVHMLDRVSDKRGVDNKRPRNKKELKYLAIGGLICGSFLCLASASQQAGMAYTTATKTSFLTTLYVLFVPIFSIFMKKKPPVQIGICVLISVIGMLLLCMGKAFMAGESFYIEKGDALVILCAVLFALQVMAVDYFVPDVDGVRLSRAQFTVVAIEATILMFIFETPTLSAVLQALPAIAYAGILSSGLAYTMQIVGQEDVDPTLASLVMSLESLFGAVSSWIVLGERMIPIEILGGLMMFGSIILAQLPLDKLKKKRPESD